MASKKAGLRIGPDIGVVGFGDRELALLSDPQLSTVRQHPEKLGFKAAELILARVDDPDGEKQHEKIKPEFVPRESTNGVILH